MGGHREYRPKRESERAHVGMEWKWPGTLEVVGKPQSSGVQAQKKPVSENRFFCLMAEREGFEPSVRVSVHLISSQARSASSGTSP